MKRRIVCFMMALIMALSLIPCLERETAHADAAGAYQTWKQYDSPWGSKVLQTMTMARGGCRVTAMAMLLVKAGWKNESSFDPGIALDLFKQTGVVIGGGMSESNISKAVPGFRYCGSQNLQPMSRTDTINFIKNLYNKGYYCELLVKNGGHAVALESVVGNTINVVDPGYGARNAFDVYSQWNSSGINHVFWFSGTAVKDTQKPTISNVSVSEVSLDGYRVSCTVADNVGVTEVYFPSWTIRGDQDDIIWHKGAINGNTASYYVRADEHKNGKGNYITHIYAKDAAGNQGIADAGVVNLSQLGDKQDIGNDFYGMLQNTMTKTVVQNTEKADSKDTARSRIVQAYHPNGQKNQLWHFQKQANGSYEISSLVDGRKLDYFGSKDVSGTQVWAYTGNGSDGQKWYFYKAADGIYYIQGAACEDTLLDLCGGSGEDAVNLQVYSINKSGAQKYAIKKYYKVSFYDNGEEKETEWIEEGKSVTAPDWKKDGYTLSWDHDLSNVREDLTINAIWMEIGGPQKTEQPDRTEIPNPTAEPKRTEEPGMNPTAEPQRTEEAWKSPTAEPQETERPEKNPTAEPQGTEEPWKSPTAVPQKSPTVMPKNTVRPQKSPTVTPQATGEINEWVQGNGNITLSAPVIKKLIRRKGRKVTVKIGKLDEHAQGYQICYSTRKYGYGKRVMIRGRYQRSRTIKNLSFHRKYYFRVRSYRIEQGRMYFSSWSNRKAVRVRRQKRR